MQIVDRNSCAHCTQYGLACWPPALKIRKDGQPAKIPQPGAPGTACLNCRLKKLRCDQVKSKYHRPPMSHRTHLFPLDVRVVTADDPRNGVSWHALAKAAVARPGSLEGRVWNLESRMDAHSAEIARWSMTGPHHLALEVLVESLLQRIAYLESRLPDGAVPESYKAYDNWGVLERSSPSDIAHLGINMRDAKAPLTQQLRDYAAEHTDDTQRRDAYFAHWVDTHGNSGLPGDYPPVNYESDGEEDVGMGQPGPSSPPAKRGELDAED